MAVRIIKPVNMKKRTILLIAVVVVAAISAYVYIQINRKPPDLTEQKAAYTRTAGALIHAFETNEQQALDSFVNKIIEVEGIVKNTEGGERTEIIVLGDDQSQTSIRFSMDSSHPVQTNAVQEGMSLRVKGICTGYNPDELGLGADIVLNKSVITYKP
jgi:hypothetical protein